MTDDRRISPEEAREIWRHAARLQGVRRLASWIAQKAEGDGA